MKRLFLFLAFVLTASIIRAQSDMTVEDLMSGDNRSLYEVLGVSRRADVTYGSLKKIINRNFPAKGDVYSEKLEEIKKGVVAFSVLSTPDLKEKYDSDGLKSVSSKVNVPILSIPLYDGEPWDAVFHTKCLFRVNYPKKEWAAKHWGTVRISYVLGADKSIRDVRIEESSGYDILDKEVLKAFSKVAKKGVKHLQPSISLVDGTPSDSRMELGIYFSKNRMGLAASEQSIGTSVAVRTGYPRGWEYISDYSRAWERVAGWRDYDKLMWWSGNWYRWNNQGVGFPNPYRSSPHPFTIQAPANSNKIIAPAQDKEGR